LETEQISDKNEELDPLICPCNCAGTVGLIHISCLKEWVNSKRQVFKGDRVISFYWKALECELCN